MVMNLDKCLGCHTCSITCKNAWTNRRGTEYMYFNNVETRPGVGYPKHWEDQESWHGGWEMNGDRLQLRNGNLLMRLLKMFYNPQQPGLDDYFEPWTYDYEYLTNAPRTEQQPVARPRSLVTRERMEISWSPNWDDDLAGTDYARQDENLKKAASAGVSLKMDMQDLFMRYLPRLCNHCLNPACVASCPSGAIYKREEDGVVLISQDKCRGWRACVPACPYKKIFFNWETNKSEKCIFCYPKLESGEPTVCSDTCVGRMRYLGVVLYDADAVERSVSELDQKDITRAVLDHVIADPFDPAVVASARKQGVAENWIRGAQDSPAYKLIKEWGLALPLHAEYRTLPMVWYIPPMSPITNKLAASTDLAEADGMRIPVEYLAELFSAGDPAPIERIINRLVAMRAHIRAKEFGGFDPALDAAQAGQAAQPMARCDLTGKQLDEMYQLLAIAKRTDRFKIPSYASPERGDRLLAQRGCGFAASSGKTGFDV